VKASCRGYTGGVFNGVEDRWRNRLSNRVSAGFKGARQPLGECEISLVDGRTDMAKDPTLEHDDLQSFRRFVDVARARSCAASWTSELPTVSIQFDKRCCASIEVILAPGLSSLNRTVSTFLDAVIDAVIHD